MESSFANFAFPLCVHLKPASVSPPSAEFCSRRSGQRASSAGGNVLRESARFFNDNARDDPFEALVGGEFAPLSLKGRKIWHRYPLVS